MHQITRTIRRGSVLGAVALLLAACVSSGTGPSATTLSTESTSTRVSGTASPTSASFLIPNGTFDATGTRRDALAKGFSNKEIDKAYGPDGELPLTLVLADGTYQAFVVGDDGVKVLGDKGTYTATERLWVAADESEGCSGCVYTYRWSFNGKVLSLKLLSDTVGPGDFRAVRLVTEHDYVKEG